MERSRPGPEYSFVPEVKGSVETRAQELLVALRAGERVSDSLRKELLEALRGQEETTRPLESDSVLEQFRNPVARREYALLSADEREQVRILVEALAQDIVAFRVANTKPIGAKLREYEEDYSGFDVLSADFLKLTEEITQRLDPSLLKAVSHRACNNYIALFPHPSQAELVVVRAHFLTPPRSAPVDYSRPIDQDYSVILRRGAAVNLLKQAENTRLLPFVWKALGIRLAPERAVFFDGSFAGKKPFGEEDNPITLFDISDRLLLSASDTRERRPASRVTTASVTEFATQVEAFMKPRGSVEKFYLHGRGTAPKRANYTRITE